MDDITVPADLFLRDCQSAIADMKEKTFAFSLGFKVDVCSIFGHTKNEVADMINLIHTYNVHEGAGIVLAINARLLVKNMSPFDKFLADFPESQLLCWVGSGEPPISARKVDRIRKHFDRFGTGDRVGFDVQTTSFAMGVVYDVIMWFMGVYHLARSSVLLAVLETLKDKAI